MKKLLILSMGAILAGCNAAPPQPQIAEPAALADNGTVTEQPLSVAVETATQSTAEVADRAESVQLAASKSVEQASNLTTTERQVAPQRELPSTVTMPTAISKAALANDPRMDKIGKLINSSSGARQVLSSDSVQAKEYHEKAKSLYAQALQSSDKAEASSLLNQSIKAMYTAIRAASPASLLAEKKQTDFDRLKRSIDTFMEQQERISDEKGSDAEGNALRSQVTTLVGEATRIFDAGEKEKGQALLRESFEMLRNSIEGMRGGETLIRSLNFATKKDEYEYELERYKSQRMLVDVLLKEKLAASAYTAKKVSGYIAVAEDERAGAEKQAAGGDHDEAVKSLERARKQIVRALRSGGIYVPG